MGPYKIRQGNLCLHWISKRGLNSVEMEAKMGRAGGETHSGKMGRGRGAAVIRIGGKNGNNINN